MFGLARPSALRRRAVALAVAAVVSSSAPAGAAVAPVSVRHAAPQPGQPTSWSLQPATATGLDDRTRFTYLNFEAGASHEDHLAVRNFTGRAETFVLYAADAINTPNGAVDVLTGPAASSGVGSWVRIPRAQVTVPPYKLAILPFSISVPSNATPGFHVGAVVASLQTDETNAQGQKIRVDYRVGSRIYLQVAGALSPKLRVDGVHLSYDSSSLAPKGGSAVVSYTVTNAGNVPLKGVADVRISGPFGLMASTTQNDVPELLPGSRVALSARVGAVFAAVHLTAGVTVHPVATVPGLLKNPPPASGSDTAWVPPWTVLIAIGLVVLLIWLKRRRLYREDERRRRRGLVAG